MELHFYPGQHLLALKQDKTVTFRFEAWGGPATVVAAPNMAEEPTWPGTYVIHSAQTYTTPTWGYSKIKWGTPLMDRKDINDIYYQLPNKKWGSVARDIRISRDEIIKLYFSYYKKAIVPPKWVFNDFGPIAVRWFKDLNNNKILDKTERLSGQMFHTTPQNEAESSLGEKVNLMPSHGCIHLKPSDRDKLIGLGAFKPKTIFIVHSYHEKI